MHSLQENLYHKAVTKATPRATQHHSYESNNGSNDEQEPEKLNDVNSLPDVVDGPCLINSMDKFMEKTFEIEYE